VFEARGLAPIGYAAFAGTLGAALGALIRRILPAMAVTLAVIVAVQVAMPVWVRPHLVPPVHRTMRLTAADIMHVGGSAVTLKVDEPGAWGASQQTVDPSRDTVSASWVWSCMPGPKPDSTCLTRYADRGLRSSVSKPLRPPLTPGMRAVKTMPLSVKVGTGMPKRCTASLKLATTVGPLTRVRAVTLSA
jgi:hypothetical protein